MDLKLKKNIYMVLFYVFVIITIILLVYITGRNIKIKQLINTESEINQLIREAIGGEEGVIESIKKLIQREYDRFRREREIDNRERAITEREKRLNEREKQINNRERERNLFIREVISKLEAYECETQNSTSEITCYI